MIENSVTSPPHTPDPWIVCNGTPLSHNGDIAIRTTRERLIAVIYAHKEAPANARLIAAAPELLDFVKRLGACANELEAHDLIVNYADDLIAKAEG